MGHPAVDLSPLRSWNEIALKPSNCRTKEKLLEKGNFYFCAKLWYAARVGFINRGGATVDLSACFGRRHEKESIKIPTKAPPSCALHSTDL